LAAWPLVLVAVLNANKRSKGIVAGWVDSSQQWRIQGAIVVGLVCSCRQWRIKGAIVANLGSCQ